MNFAGAVITVRDHIPEAVRRQGPEAIRAHYRKCIDAMNRTSAALSCGGVVLTAHGYDRQAGDLKITGMIVDGRRAVVDDLYSIGKV